MLGLSSRVVNANHYRQVVNHAAMPDKSAVSIEGLINEYYFQTGTPNTDDLVYPSFSVSKSIHPLTNEEEIFVAVGCGCRDDGKNLRNKLNLVVVLDMSGSMGSPFDTYRSNSSEMPSRAESSKTKIDVAKEVLQEVVRNLRPDERIGIVLFDDRTELLQPLRSVSHVDVDNLCERISEIRARGGTDMEKGYELALEILKDLHKDKSESIVGYDSRIIFLTDANPNLGGGSKSLYSLSVAAARRKIYTTFVGVGLDFRTDLVDKLTKVRGANYFSVNSSKEFKKILNEDFNYIVTPVAFDGVLFMESEAFQIEKVYGTPYDSESKAVMKVDTITASPKDERGLKGGLVLLKLKHKLTSNESPSSNLTFIFTYEDREGKKGRITKSINLEETLAKIKGTEDESDLFENSGVRKAVLLVRYVNLVHDMIEEKFYSANNDKSDGILHTRTTTMSSKGLSDHMKQSLTEFKQHFKSEMDNLLDKSLGRELDMLDKFKYNETKN